MNTTDSNPTPHKMPSAAESQFLQSSLLAMAQAHGENVSNGPPARPCPDTPPPPDSLILAGFSGGGQALNEVVMTKGGHYHRLLSEVWCFDCMYSGEGGKWANWAQHHDGVKLRVRLSSGEGSGSPRGQAHALHVAAKGLDDVDVGAEIHSTHEALPGKCIPSFLEDA